MCLVTQLYITLCDPMDGSPQGLFCGQEYWSGLPFSSPGNLPNPVIALVSLASPALANRLFTAEAPGKPCVISEWIQHQGIINHKLRLCAVKSERVTFKSLPLTSTYVILCACTHLQPDILECEVKWALGRITTNKASGGDGISVELFQILKDDALTVLHSICQQIWKTQQWPQDWKRSIFIPILKKGCRGPA